jgi:hypothetical protein
MTNRKDNLNLFRSMTGRTNIVAPRVDEQRLEKIVGYFPSWAREVRRR